MSSCITIAFDVSDKTPEEVLEIMNDLVGSEVAIMNEGNEIVGNVTSVGPYAFHNNVLYVSIYVENKPDDDKAVVDRILNDE